MDGVSTQTSVRLDDAFARALPELAVSWRAEEAPDPRLLVLNEPLAHRLGLDPDHLRSPEGVGLLLGTDVPEGANPVAQGYAGHQFGGWSPRLGDGRALLLGELTTTDGQVRDLHLKGSGRTPWARGGDGLAGIGPMMREYVVSEAMHALGVPTTRSLAVVATGMRVLREEPQPGAVLARVASSHLRVGSFQYVRASGDEDLLRRLVDHAVERHHPEAAGAEVPALALFEAVVAAQARLVAQWMLLGFVHGVMNTDNMTISGETIDYGPCAFMEAYDPATVFSSIDQGGRYAYGNQPLAALWNLARLAEALVPLVDPDQETAIGMLEPAVRDFDRQYADAWASGMHAKLGVTPGPDDTLVDDLLALLHDGHVDLTSFFRHLTAAAEQDSAGQASARQDAGQFSARQDTGPVKGAVEPVRSLFLDLAGIDAWLGRWRALGPDPVAMRASNPVYVPRNHLVEEALAAAVAGDLEPVHTLLDAVTDPYRERPGLERYAEPAPEQFGRYVTYCGT